NTVDALVPPTGFNQLSYRQDDPSKTYSTSIARGVTLTLANSTSPSTSLATSVNSSLVVMPTAAATATVQSGATAVISSATDGAGALGGLKITSGNVMISGRPGASVAKDSYAILDLSGLDSFTYTQATNSVFAVGQGNTTNGSGGTDNNAYWGKLILGTNTSIAVNRFI